MELMVILLPAAVFVTVALLVVALYRAFLAEHAIARRRLVQYAGKDQVAEKPGQVDSSILRERRLSAFSGLDRLLQQRSFAEGIALDLARASVPLRVGEYLLIRVVLALLLFLVVWTLSRYLLPAAGGAALGYFLPKFYVRHLQQARAGRFNDQLVDTITLISNSLKSGYSFLQGMEAVAREMPAPTAEEFARLLQDLRVGSHAEEALVRMAGRVRSDDLDMVVTAILIHRAAGGNLSEVLDNIAHTIRERVRIMREVRTLTAQERMSGYIIGALPVFLLVVISMGNPSYAGMLLYTPSGQMMLAAAFVLELVGFWMIRRIVAIEV